MNTYGIDETISCPNGFYFGDPCYVLSDDDYQSLMDEMFKDDKYNGRVGKFTIGGYELVLDNTAYGDGDYPGANCDYGVDAGMLGIVPIELCKKQKSSKIAWTTTELTGNVRLETNDYGDFKVTVNGKHVEEVHTDSFAHEDDDEYCYEEIDY